MQKKGVFDNLPWSCFIVQINMKTNRQQEITKTDFNRNKKKVSPVVKPPNSWLVLCGACSWTGLVIVIGPSKLGNSMIPWFEDNGVD